MSRFKILAVLYFLFCSTLAIGQNWVPAGSGFSGTPYRFFVDSVSSTLYASGPFPYAGNIPVKGAAQYNGVEWDSIQIPITNGEFGNIFRYKDRLVFGYNPVLSWDGIKVDTVAVFTKSGVSMFAIYKDELLALGTFDSINAIAASHIARWNGSEWKSFDTTRWYGLGPGVTIEYKGDLYVGGNMWNYDGTLDRLARWNGTKWMPVGNGITGGSAGVNCFEVYNGDLYIGGAFYTWQGNPGNAIARWDGTQWKDVGPGMTSGNAALSALQIYNGELYACGAFTKLGDIPVLAIAKWDGHKWCGLGQKFIPDFTISMNCMAVYNNELYVGGPFLAIDGDTVNRVAKWTGGDYTDTCGAIVGLDEIDTEGFIMNVFPNPCSDKLHCVTTTVNQNTVVQIYSVDGRVIIENIPVTKNDFEIDVSSLSSGLYFLVLHDDKQRGVRRFVKE